MDAHLSISTKRLRRVALVAISWALNAPAGAHHSFAVHFVPEGRVTVSGVVTHFRFTNPHGLLFLDVTNEQGAAEQWKAETNSPNILRRRGWSETSIKAGDRVTIEGYPARDGSKFMRIARVAYADGRELIGQRPDPSAAGGEED
jgi:hypothetical protein